MIRARARSIHQPQGCIFPRRDAPCGCKPQFRRLFRRTRTNEGGFGRRGGPDFHGRPACGFSRGGFVSRCTETGTPEGSNSRNLASMEAGMRPESKRTGGRHENKDEVRLPCECVALRFLRGAVGVRVLSAERAGLRRLVCRRKKAPFPFSPAFLLWARAKTGRGLRRTALSARGASPGSRGRSTPRPGRRPRSGTSRRRRSRSS